MPTITLELPKPYPKQREAIWADARIAIIEAGTKNGKTVGCMLWMLDRLLNHGAAGRNYWWVAPVYPQAKIAYRRIKRLLKTSGFPHQYWQSHDTDLTISVPGCGTIWFKSAEKPDNLYGEDVYAAVIDEASRMREDAWFAIQSTVTATRAPIRIIGNVKGRGNWFYKVGLQARQGDKSMHYAKLTCWDAVAAGILSREEVEERERTLPPHVFRQLYLAEPADDGGNPFGIEAIRRCVRPLSDGEPVAWGIDLAKSQDWCWAIALDEAGDMCRSERWRSPWNETETRILGLVGDVPTLIDSTGVGDPIVERLQRTAPNIEGFKFTSESKQRIMEGLASAIHRQAVGLSGDDLLAELESFEYEETRTGVKYSAPDGLHDDGPCALALVVYHRERVGSVSVLWASEPERRKDDGLTVVARFAQMRDDPDWGF